MTTPHIIFFRGLNTYGHDHAQLSILRLGPMFKHMQRELTRRDCVFHPVLNMGVGPLSEVADRATDSVTKLPVWADDSVPVHFVGHSAGGLVARLVLDRLGARRRPDGNPKIASLLTIASPHRGSGLAQVFVDMPTLYPGSARIFRGLGYDIRPKLRVFETMTAAHVARTMNGVDAARFGDVRTGSVVCAPQRSTWSRVMRAFHKMPAFRAFADPSDGMIEASAQVFGDQVYNVNLDHFQQAGFFGRRAEFRRMCDLVAKFAREAQASPRSVTPGTSPSAEIRNESL